MKLVFTGFDPFAEHTINPSQEAVELLPDFVKFGDKSISVAKLILPTCCLDAWQLLENELDKSSDSQFAIILSGLASTRSVISLERFALNIRDYRVPDNNEHQWNEEHIEPDGPDALRCKLPLIKLNQDLLSAGFASEVTNHAGTFVCNETYYRSLHRYSADERCKGILFVHLPPYESYPAADSDPESTEKANQAKHPREIYADCLLRIAQFIAGI